MRISDWSSDVCSSDLDCFTVRPAERLACEVDVVTPARQRRVVARQSRGSFQHRAGAGEVEVAAGTPPRILVRLGGGVAPRVPSDRLVAFPPLEHHPPPHSDPAPPPPPHPARKPG